MNEWNFKAKWKPGNMKWERIIDMMQGRGRGHVVLMTCRRRMAVGGRKGG